MSADSDARKGQDHYEVAKAAWEEYRAASVIVPDSATVIAYFNCCKVIVNTSNEIVQPQTQQHMKQQRLL